MRATNKPDTTASEQPISLAASLSSKPLFKSFFVWIVGDTPLIVHAWSEKAKREMLGKQVGAVRAGRAPKDPDADFKASLYEMGDGTYGFPAMGIKNCVLSAAHKDKGVPRSSVQAALWLNADIVRVRPALAGAICDMPLVRIFGGKPEMREDMVKVGKGLNKTAALAYRAQFTPWAIRLTGRFNSSTMNEEQLAFTVQEAGTSFGIGDWRNERKGVFGSFHLADLAEEAAWERFARDGGKVPMPSLRKLAA